MRTFLRQLRYEQLVFWRSREAAIFVFLLPVLLFVLLGAIYSGDVEGYPAEDYLLIGMLGYGVANTAFGGVAIFLVLRREYGILKRIRSTPLPAPAYIAAVIASTLVVFVLQSVVLVVLGLALYDADLPRAAGSLVVALLFGAVAFAAIGAGAATVIRSAEGSSPIVNVVILPMAFLSGSFGSPDDYPAVLRVIGDILPLKYVIELVVDGYLDGTPIWEKPGAIAVVAAWGAFGGLIAARRFSWEPRAR